jgi:hypothetical protein
MFTVDNVIIGELNLAQLITKVKSGKKGKTVGYKIFDRLSLKLLMERKKEV